MVGRGSSFFNCWDDHDDFVRLTVATGNRFIGDVKRAVSDLGHCVRLRHQGSGRRFSALETIFFLDSSCPHCGHVVGPSQLRRQPHSSEARKSFAQHVPARQFVKATIHSLSNGYHISVPGHLRHLHEVALSWRVQHGFGLSFVSYHDTNGSSLVRASAVR